MLSVLLYAAIGSLIFAALVYNYFRVPSHMPKNIPTIPFYVTLAGLWTNMGQDESFEHWLRKPLSEYGAVKMWYRGHWSILATRPDLLNQILRNEEHIYAKVGNYTKVPWTVIAALVGDNLLGAHGDTWKLYAEIMKPGLIRPHHDTRMLREKSRQFASLLLGAQVKGCPNGVKVERFIQRFTLAAMGEAFLNVDFGVSNSPSQAKHGVLIAITDTGSAWRSYR